MDKMGRFAHRMRGSARRIEDEPIVQRQGTLRDSLAKHQHVTGTRQETVSE
jgi:hypothetical protein